MTGTHPTASGTPGTRPAAGPRVHLVYRLYAGENRKGRPDFYGKRLCLASFLLAARTAREADPTGGYDVSVLADGPIPADVRDLVGTLGSVVDIPGGPTGMRGSYRAAMAEPDRAGWPDEDVVYFSEDDYLHVPEAFLRLRAAAGTLVPAQYFALYASTPAHPAFGPGVPWGAPAAFRPAPDVVADGATWVNVPSTASTFGARIGALRRDRGIIRQGMLPHRNRLLDHETCLVYQGCPPYRVVDLLLGPEGSRYYSGWRAVAANIVFTPFRVAFQARSLTRRRRPHLLYAADPNLACHLETEFMSPGRDWRAVAERARRWAEQQGFDTHTAMTPQAGPGAAGSGAGGELREAG